jgi:hypothetical protein
MNIGEAIDVHTVLKHFIGVGRSTRMPFTHPEEARIAAMRLADRAHKALKAGPDAVDVSGAWRALPPERKRGAKQ